MSSLQIAAIGFAGSGEPAGTPLPPALKATGWGLILHPSPAPKPEWIAVQPVDLFLLPADLEQVMDLTLQIGRLRPRPVVWVGENGREGPPGIWERIQSRDWPLWGFLPVDAPGWLVVTLCRGLVAAQTRLQAALDRSAELERKLEDRKIIERAKGILMDQFDLAESEAYRRLRETAMRQRKSLREIAQGILAFAEDSHLG